jgi:hypothetical protein
MARGGRDNTAQTCSQFSDFLGGSLHRGPTQRLPDHGSKTCRNLHTEMGKRIRRTGMLFVSIGRL